MGLCSRTGGRFPRAVPRGRDKAFANRKNTFVFLCEEAPPGASRFRYWAFPQECDHRQRYRALAGSTEAAAGKRHLLVSLRTGDLFKQPMGFPRCKLSPDPWAVANFKESERRELPGVTPARGSTGGLRPRLASPSPPVETPTAGLVPSSAPEESVQCSRYF